jgi:AraC-like DNA-binding protein
LRHTGYAVADICCAVGLTSVGSFTTSFTRVYGLPPAACRAAHPPAAHCAMLPGCVVRVYGRPKNRTFREDAAESGRLA